MPIVASWCRLTEVTLTATFGSALRAFARELTLIESGLEPFTLRGRGE